MTIQEEKPRWIFFLKFKRDQYDANNNNNKVQVLKQDTEILNAILTITLKSTFEENFSFFE